jgi:hypothetical protein
MTPSLQSAVTRFHEADNGSAVVGFVLGAPLIALLGTYCISIAGFVWSRELASEIVRSAVHRVAIHESDQASAARTMADEFALHGWSESSFQWNVANDVRPALLQLTVSYRDSVLPGMPRATISETAVVE